MDNLPVKALLGTCEKVIAVSISPLRETEDLDNLIKIASRTFQLSVNAQTRELQGDCALFIEPDGVRDYDLFDVGKADELFEVGYDSVTKADLQKILK